MSQRGPQDISPIAHEIAYIHDRVGLGPWRLAAGLLSDSQTSVPYVDLPDWADITVGELLSSGAAKKRDRITIRRPWADNYHQRARVYELTRYAAETAKRLVSPDGAMLPCGHGGIVNPRDVEGYQCKHAGCDAVFAREAVDR
jgi:hypothetical protein